MSEHGHRFNPEHVTKLLSNQRRESLPPDKILAQLNIKEADKIYDLGAGNGYYIIPIAGMTRAEVLNPVLIKVF